MYRNFEMLNDIDLFEDQAEIFARIERVFYDLKEDELGNIGSSVRKITEDIFISTEELGYDGMLAEKINQMKEEYNIPMNVLHGLYNIKAVTNRESHGSLRRSDRSYQMDLTIGEAETLLRNLWMFIKWIALIKYPDFDAPLKYKEKTKRSVKKDDELTNNNADMSAEKLTLAQLIFSKGFKFNVPTYQRDYTWTKENVKKLFDDIEKRKDDAKTHYFGSLAIAIDVKKKLYRIIDGQQRISTSLLMFKAFYDVMKKNGQKIPATLQTFIDDKIRTIYINQEVLSSQKALSLILKGGKPTPDLPKLPERNYNYLVERISGHTPEEIVELFTVFSVNFEVATLVFDTSVDNEMDVFENLNTGGTKLQDWDLIRSYMFSKVEPNIFEESESQIDKSLNNNILLPFNVVTNNKPKNMLEKFFTSYNRIKVIEQSADLDGVKGNYNVFKQIWKYKNKKFKSFSEFQDEMANINKEIKLFIELKYPYESEKLKPYAHIISYITTRDDIMPTLIIAAKQYCVFKDEGELKTISADFIKIIRILESYIIRSNVYGNNFNDSFDNYLAKNKEDISGSLFESLKKFPQVFGSLEEFKQKLKNNGTLKKATIMSIVTHLELIARDIPLGKSAMVTFEKTHEHIIAQKLKYENYDDPSVTKEEFNELVLSRKDSIGNALLLSLGDNASAGNKKFALKHDVYRKSAKAASKLNGVMDLLEKETFTFNDVTKRAEQIANFIIDNEIYYDE